MSCTAGTSEAEQSLSEAVAALTEGMLSAIPEGNFATIYSLIFERMSGGKSQSDLKSSVVVVEEAARKDGLLPGHILSLSSFIASRSASVCVCVYVC